MNATSNELMVYHPDKEVRTILPNPTQALLALYSERDDLVFTPPYPRVRVSTTMSKEAQALLALGSQQRWKVNYLGEGSMPCQAVIQDQWLFLPDHLDTSPRHPKAVHRMRVVQERGIPLQGYVMIHEMASQHPKEKSSPSAWPPVDTNRFNVRRPLRAMLAGVGSPFGTAVGKGILAVGSILLAAAVALPVLMVTALAQVDPICVAVTWQDEWIEIFRWNSKG